MLQNKLTFGWKPE